MPLSGLRVLDLTRLLPGPFCTMVFADLGADVIKVEDLSGGDYIRWTPPLQGDYSAMYYTLNRNKRSIRLDLKAEAGREAFLRLVETADVVVESFRPGVLDRLRVGYQELRRRNRGVILCSISGYGQDGPYRDRAGHDLNYIAIGGALGMTGTRDGTVAMPGVQVGDIGGGAMSAAIAVLAALHHRERTGEGQHCDVSMLDGVVTWLSLHAARYFFEGHAPGPAGTHLNGRHPCYNLYRCADGVMSVGALEPKFWAALVEALGVPHLAGDAFADGEDADRVHAELEAVFLRRTRAQWVEALAGRDVCCEPVLGLDEVFDHEQVRHRHLQLEAGSGGPGPVLGFPFRLSATPPAVRRPAPGYGEHTREVLLEAGYDAAAIEAMLADGAVA
ncbi:MAG: CoA transferase [Chloroflexi bacterium]|nr:MAG: CoA transferase [Chloroflexota bacterium]